MFIQQARRVRFEPMACISVYASMPYLCVRSGHEKTPHQVERGSVENMSEVYEGTPTHCPAGHPWGQGDYLVGWESNPLVGGVGHRTWTCQTCGTMVHAETVEL